MPKSPLTGRERFRSHHHRQIAAGNARVAVYVPAEDSERFKAFGAHLKLARDNGGQPAIDGALEILDRMAGTCFFSNACEDSIKEAARLIRESLGEGGAHDDQ